MKEHLNTLLDLVYLLQDSSSDMSNHLDKIIGDIVVQVEKMADIQEDIMENWK